MARTPEKMAAYLDGEDLALYRLIWNRTVASQMTDAKLDKTAVDFAVATREHALTFRSNGSIVSFPGFLQVYGDRDRDALLPELSEGMRIGGATDTPVASTPHIVIPNVEPLRHETAPPARYTEASLIKKLEEEGIGRPSTYAPVISTIQSRDYVTKKGGALLPSYIGIAVTHLLRDHFDHYVDVKFTARMEEDLDQIAAGEMDWIEFLDDFCEGRRGRPGPDQDHRAGDRAHRFPAHPRGHRSGDRASPSTCASAATTSTSHVEGASGPARHPAGGSAHRRADRRRRPRADRRRATRRASPSARTRRPARTSTPWSGPFGPYLQLGEPEGDKKPKRMSLGKGTDITDHRPASTP